MNQWIKRLCDLSQQPERWILGAISGTSMDGVDLALCRIRGASRSTTLELVYHGTAGLDPTLMTRCRELAFRPESQIGKLLPLHRELSQVWSRAIRQQMEHWGISPEEIDLIASHGQTIYHAPDRDGPMNATMQLVDGDFLSRQLGIITISDFRQKHIAAGYEGAPLVPLAESLLFGSLEEDRILLNLGGIGNLTLLPAGDRPDGIPYATDTGPANTLLDEAVRHLLPGRQFDDGGALARTGSIREPLLERLLEHPFFGLELPRSTGQEDFSWEWLHSVLMQDAPDLSVADLLATLTELTAIGVARAVPSAFLDRASALYISGGGWHNRYLVERIETNLSGIQAVSSDQLGIEPDAKEALLFAVLANETVAGSGWFASDGRPLTLGRISLP